MLEIDRWRPQAAVGVIPTLIHLPKFMFNSKTVIVTLLFSLSFIASSAHAETTAFYAGKIVSNCDYQASLKKPLEKSFTANELRTLRIAISVDEAVCHQTHAYLTGAKVSRKESQRFVKEVVRTHEDGFDEAAATD